MTTMKPQHSSGAIKLKLHDMNINYPNTIINNSYITIVYLKKDFTKIHADISQNFENFFGNNMYNLSVVQKWNNNYCLTKSWQCNNQIGLEIIRTGIINYINNKYPGSIDKSCYNSKTWTKFYADKNLVAYHKSQVPQNLPPDGLPPEHINTYGNTSLIGQSFYVKYTIQ